MRSCKGRLDNELLKLKTPMRVVAATMEGLAEFELLPPFGGDLSPQHRAKFERASALLASTFPKNAKQVKNYVYRNRNLDGTRATEETTYDACLLAGLWLKDDLVSAASLRVNILPNGGQHVQTVYQATEPSKQQRGLGRLLTRCIIKAAAVAGHRYATVVVLGKEVAGYWTKMGFSTTSSRDEHGAITAVGASQLHAPKSAVWLMRLWAGEERLEEVEAGGPEAVVKVHREAAAAAQGARGPFTLEQALAVVEAQKLVDEAARKVVARFGDPAAPGAEPAAGGASQVASASKGPEPTTTGQRKAPLTAATPASRRRGRGDRAQAAKAGPAAAAASMSMCTQGSAGGAALMPCPPRPPVPQLAAAAWPVAACDVDSAPTSPGPVGQQLGGGLGFDSAGGAASAAGGGVLLPSGVRVWTSGFNSGEDEDDDEDEDDEDVVVVGSEVRAGGGGSSAGGSSVEGGGGGAGIGRGDGEKPAPAAAAGMAPRNGSTGGLPASGGGPDGVVAEREGPTFDVGGGGGGAARTAKPPKLANEPVPGEEAAVAAAPPSGGAGGAPVAVLRLCPSIESRGSSSDVKEGGSGANMLAEVPVTGRGQLALGDVVSLPAAPGGRTTATAAAIGAAAAGLTLPTASGCGRGVGGASAAAVHDGRAQGREKPAAVAAAAVTDSKCDLTLESPPQASAGRAIKVTGDGETTSSVEVLGEVQGGAWLATASRGRGRSNSRGASGGCSEVELLATTPETHHNSRSEPDGRAASKPSEAVGRVEEKATEGGERRGPVTGRSSRDGESRRRQLLEDQSAVTAEIEEEKEEGLPREERGREMEREGEGGQKRRGELDPDAAVQDAKRCRISAERQLRDAHAGSRLQMFGPRPTPAGSLASSRTTGEGRPPSQDRMVARVAAHIAAYAATHNVAGLAEHSTGLAASLVTAFGVCGPSSAAEGAQGQQEGEEVVDGVLNLVSELLDEDPYVLSDDDSDVVSVDDTGGWSDAPAPRRSPAREKLLRVGVEQQHVEPADTGPSGAVLPIRESASEGGLAAAGGEAGDALGHGSMQDRRRVQSRSERRSGDGQGQLPAKHQDGVDTDARRPPMSLISPPTDASPPRTSQPRKTANSSGEVVPGRCTAPAGAQGLVGADKCMEAGGVKRKADGDIKDNTNMANHGGNGKVKCTVDRGSTGTGTTAASSPQPEHGASKPVPPAPNTDTAITEPAVAAAATKVVSVGAEAPSHGHRSQQEGRREEYVSNHEPMKPTAPRTNRWGSLPAQAAGAAGAPTSSGPTGTGQPATAGGGKNACVGKGEAAKQDASPQGQGGGAASQPRQVPTPTQTSPPYQPLPPTSPPLPPQPPDSSPPTVHPPPPSQPTPTPSTSPTGQAQATPNRAAETQAASGSQKPSQGTHKPAAQNSVSNSQTAKCPQQQQHHRVPAGTTQPPTAAHQTGKEPSRPKSDVRPAPGAPGGSESVATAAKPATQQTASGTPTKPPPQQQRHQPHQWPSQSAELSNEPSRLSPNQPYSWRKPTASVAASAQPAASAAPLQRKPSWSSQTSQQQQQQLSCVPQQLQCTQQLSPWSQHQRQQPMHMQHGHYLPPPPHQQQQQQQQQVNMLPYWSQMHPMYPYPNPYYQNY